MEEEIEWRGKMCVKPSVAHLLFLKHLVDTISLYCPYITLAGIRMELFSTV